MSFNLSQTFTYKGTGQVYTVPKSGEYLLEVWGAQGGNAAGHPNHRTAQNQPISLAAGGLGGYTRGKIKLEMQQKLYVFVGGQGNQYTGSSSISKITGGFNGGGSSNGCNAYGGGAGGGGATHISTVNDVLQKLSKSDVLIVSGGGGGASGCLFSAWDTYRGLSEGGQGGGLIGGRAGYDGSMGYTGLASNTNIYNQGDSNSQAFNYATGGTQTSGGVQGCAKGSNSYLKTDIPADFGKGADSGNAQGNSGGGGGSGFYGGGAGASGNNPWGTGGGGGSSYVASSMYDTLLNQGVNIGHGKAVISPLFNIIQECKTFGNCQIYLSLRLFYLSLVFITTS